MNDASRENGFFRWVRELGLHRGEDNWVGGVASGVGQRWGISTILVRGIIVALCFVAGLGLFLYGIAWALLPGQDGKIHLQEAIAGRWASGMTGALVFSIVGAVGSPAIFGGHNSGFFGWWDGGLWTLLIIAGVCWLIFSRRGHETPDARHYTPQDNDPFGPPAATPTAGFDSPHNRAPGQDVAAPDATVPFTTDRTKHEGQVSSAMVLPGQDPLRPGAPQSLIGPLTAQDAAKYQAGKDTPTLPLGSLGKTNGTPQEEQTMDSSTPKAADPAAPASPSTPRDTAGTTREAHSSPASGNGPPTPPIRPVPPAAAGSAPQAPRPARTKAIPGYAATIVLGLAVLAFAMITGLSQLGMLTLPVNPVSVGFAVVLIVIALGLIGAALNKRTGGALVGFGIVALIFSLLWGGGSFRDSGPISSFRGITTTENGETTNVFHSGELDLRSYSSITSDTTVEIDNVFSSMKLIVPDNIPVVIDSQSAFGSQKINGATAQIRNGSTVLNADTGGPELRLKMDGAFSSIEINVEKAEFAP